MKKIFSFLTIALVAICAFSFASCSSDDDDEKFSTSDVLGTWVTTSVQTSDGIWVDLTNPLYLTHANFVITADSDTEEAMTPERTFIYSRLNIPYWSGAVYIQHHFLTTLSSFVLPRNAVQCISFLALPNKTLTCYTECLIHAVGEPTPHVVRLEENHITYTALRLCTVNMMPEL